MQTIYDPRYATLCGNIRAVRQGRDLTLEMLSERLANRGWPINRNVLSEIENAQRRLDVLELFEICCALEVDWRMVLPVELRGQS